jgi:hypothetical protein
MRRTSACLAVLGLLVLALPGMASATPTVAIKGKAIPIPGFPHTGNILGAGTDVQGEVTISGTEYDGSPPPVIGVTVTFPTGSKVHPQGFKTCSKATLELKRGKGCPKGSAAGPVGHALGVVSLGNTRVPEEATIESFFAPGGGLLFYTEGNSPVQLEFISVGHLANLNGAGGVGPQFIAEVPLVETLPGAPDASAERINLTIGAAYRTKSGTPVYYATVPKKCPKGGFPVKAELTFAGVGGLPQQVASASFKSPCPRK